MYCFNCGNQLIKPDSKYCSGCGASIINTSNTCNNISQPSYNIKTPESYRSKYVFNNIPITTNLIGSIVLITGLIPTPILLLLTGANSSVWRGIIDTSYLLWILFGIAIIIIGIALKRDYLIKRGLSANNIKKTIFPVIIILGSAALISYLFAWGWFI